VLQAEWRSPLGLAVRRRDFINVILCVSHRLAARGPRAAGNADGWHYDRGITDDDPRRPTLLLLADEVIE
jgi:hypothetical protein